MSFNSSKDKELPPFFFVEAESSSKARKEEILSEELLIVSDHPIFNDRSVSFKAIEILTYLANFMKLDPHYQGSTASYVFLSSLQPSFNKRKKDRDVIFYAQNTKQLNSLSCAIQQFVINKVIPELKIELSDVTKNKIVRSFIKNSKPSSEFCNILLGPSLDLTITLKPYYETYRCIYDSIKWNVFKKEYPFLIASEGQKNVNLVFKAIENQVFIYNIDKIKSSNDVSFFYYMWIFTQGCIPDEKCLKLVCKKLMDRFDNSTWFENTLVEYIQKHIIEKEASMVFLLNIAFLVSVYGLDSSSQKLDQILGHVRKQLGLVIQNQTHEIRMPKGLLEMIHSNMDIPSFHDELIYASSIFFKCQNKDRLPEVDSTAVKLEEIGSQYVIKMRYTFGSLCMMLMKKNIKGNISKLKSFELMSKTRWKESEFEQIGQKEQHLHTTVKTMMNLVPSGFFDDICVPKNLDLKGQIKNWENLFIEIYQTAKRASIKTPYITVCQKIICLLNAFNLDQEVLNRFRNSYLEIIIDDFRTALDSSLDAYTLPFLSTGKMAYTILMQLINISFAKEWSSTVLQKILPHIDVIPNELSSEKKGRLRNMLSNLLRNEEIDNHESFLQVFYNIRILSQLSNGSFNKRVSQSGMNAIEYAYHRLLKNEDDPTKDPLNFLVDFFKKQFPSECSKLMQFELELSLKDQTYNESLKFLIENQKSLSYDIRLLASLLQHCPQDGFKIITLGLECLPNEINDFMDLWNIWRGSKKEKIELFSKVLLSSQDLWTSELFLDWVITQHALISSLDQKVQTKCIEWLQILSPSIEVLNKSVQLLGYFEYNSLTSNAISGAYYKFILTACYLKDATFGKKIYDIVNEIIPLSKVDRHECEQFISQLIVWQKKNESFIFTKVLQDSFEWMTLEQKEEILNQWLTIDSLLAPTLDLILKNKIKNYTILKECFARGLKTDEKIYFPLITKIMMSLLDDRIDERVLELFLGTVTIIGGVELFTKLFRLLIKKGDPLSLSSVKLLLNIKDIEDELKISLANEWIQTMLGRKSNTTQDLLFALELIQQGKSSKKQGLIFDAMIKSQSKEYTPTLKKALFKENDSSTNIKKILNAATLDNQFLELAESLLNVNVEVPVLLDDFPKVLLQIQLMVKRFELRSQNKVLNNSFEEIFPFFNGIQGIVNKNKSLIKEKQETALLVINCALGKKANLLDYTKILNGFITKFPQTERHVLVNQLLLNLVTYEAFKGGNSHQWELFLSSFFVNVVTLVDTPFRQTMIESLYAIALSMQLRTDFVLSFYIDNFESLPINDLKKAEKFIDCLNSFRLRHLVKEELKIIDGLTLLMKNFGTEFCNTNKFFEILAKLPSSEQCPEDWIKKSHILLDAYFQVLNKSYFSKEICVKAVQSLLSPKGLHAKAFLGLLDLAIYYYNILYTNRNFDEIKPVLKELINPICGAHSILLSHDINHFSLACIHFLLSSQRYFSINHVTKDARYQLFRSLIQDLEKKSFYAYTLIPYLRKIMKGINSSLNLETEDHFSFQLTFAGFICQKCLEGVNNIGLFEGSFTEVVSSLDEIKKSQGYQKFILDKNGDESLRKAWNVLYTKCVKMLTNNFVRLNLATYSEVFEHHSTFKEIQDLFKVGGSLAHQEDLSQLDIALLGTKKTLSKQEHSLLNVKIISFIKEWGFEISKTLYFKLSHINSLSQSVTALTVVLEYLKLEIYNPYRDKIDSDQLIAAYIKIISQYLEKNEMNTLKTPQIISPSTFFDLCCATLQIDSKNTIQALMFLEKIDFKSSENQMHSMLAFRMLLKTFILSEDPLKREFAQSLLYSDIQNRFHVEEEMVMHLIAGTIDTLLENPSCSNPNAFEDALNLVHHYLYVTPFKNDQLFFVSLLRTFELILLRPILMTNQDEIDRLVVLFCCVNLAMMNDMKLPLEVIQLQSDGMIPIFGVIQVSRIITTFMDLCKPIQDKKMKPSSLIQFGKIYDQMYLNLLKHRGEITKSREAVISLNLRAIQVFFSCLNIPHVFDQDSFQLSYEELIVMDEKKVEEEKNGKK